jgi:phosphoserine phosphatase RsbU/P
MCDFMDLLKPRLAILAEAWLSSGATAYGLWEDGHPLVQWPDQANGLRDSMSPVVIPVYMEGASALELRVAGVDCAAAQNRLRGEAALLAGLIQLEEELDAMTTRLIETQDQLLALYDLTHAARSPRSIEDALDSLASMASRLLRVDSAFAVLAMPDETPIVAQQPVTLLSNEQSLWLFHRVQAEQRQLLTSMELLNTSQGPSSMIMCSLCVMPIVVLGQVSAALGLVKKVSQPFTSPEIKLARTVAEQGGAQLENGLLLQETLAQARIQTEMELAKHVQLRLLPQKLPNVQGLDLAACAHPALQVGGDFYDFVGGVGRPLTFVVGDVSGKGMAAALLMSMMRTAVSTIARVEPQTTPAAIVEQANDRLYDDLTQVGAFVTVFVGQYDSTTRQLHFANAGHSPVIYCPKDGPARLLESDGPGIGVLPSSLCKDQSLLLRPDDLLIAGTDGFSEAHNAAEEMFGHERLLMLSAAQAPHSASQILNAWLDAVAEFSSGHPQDDDQTAVVLRGVPT